MTTATSIAVELAWLYTRELIGHGLRRRYEVAKDLPLELLELVRKLDAGEGNHSMCAADPGRERLTR